MATPIPTSTLDSIKSALDNVKNLIDSGTLNNNQSLITLPDQPVDNTNYKGIVDSSSVLTTPPAKTEDTMPSWLKTYLDQSTPPANPADTLSTLNIQNEIDAKSKLVNDLTAKLNTITAEGQTQNLKAEDFVGTGSGTTNISLSRQQAENNRQTAIRVLPVQAQLAAAQGNLTLAQDKVNTLFKVQSDYATNLLNYNKDLREKVMAYASDAEKAKLVAQDKADTQAFTLMTNNLNQGQSLANTAITNGQGDIASKIMALDPKSKTYTTDLAILAGQIKPKATAASTAADKPLSSTDIVQYQADHPDAGITMGDTYNSAIAKINALKTPKTFTTTDFTTAIQADKTANKTYEQVLTDIDSNSLIANKDDAKQVAAQVYGKVAPAPTPDNNNGGNNGPTVSIDDRISALKADNPKISGMQLQTKLQQEGYNWNDIYNKTTTPSPVVGWFNKLFGKK